MQTWILKEDKFRDLFSSGRNKGQVAGRYLEVSLQTTIVSIILKSLLKEVIIGRITSQWDGWSVCYNFLKVIESYPFNVNIGAFVFITKFKLIKSLEISRSFFPDGEMAIPTFAASFIDQTLHKGPTHLQADLFSKMQHEIRYNLGGSEIIWSAIGVGWGGVPRSFAPPS